MSDQKTPFSEAYVKTQRSFLQATIIFFGSLCVLAVVYGIVRGTSADQPFLFTIAVLCGFWATTAIFRKATLEENVRTFKAIESLRSKE